MRVTGSPPAEADPAGVGGRGNDHVAPDSGYRNEPSLVDVGLPVFGLSVGFFAVRRDDAVFPGDGTFIVRGA